MPKYYIQSGTVSFVVSACDPEGAALWAMHRMMDEKICDYEDQIMDSIACLLYTSPSPRDATLSRMPSSA